MMDKGQQFSEPMFMSANEILNTYRLKDRDKSREETSEQVLARKLLGSKRPDYFSDGSGSLYDSIVENGISTPITLLKNFGKDGAVVWDGHHRLAVQHALDPDAPVIPVRHIGT